MNIPILAAYDRSRTYQWNYEHAPDPVELDVPTVSGEWDFCGLPVDSPLGIPAGPLLNGKWCLYYASLGFDVVTYKTVRSSERACYPLPNLQPVRCGQLTGGESEIPACDEMSGSWAVSYGMPSKSPDVWRRDIQWVRDRLPNGKLLSVSTVGTVQPGWSIEDLATDYARCAKWAVESGADVVETNFSCPNVTTCDGQLYQQPEAARLVARTVRDAVGKTPYIAKIGHVGSREEAAQLLTALSPDVDALAMTNSVATRVCRKGSLLFDGQPRGICGEAIFDASLNQLAMFAQVASELGIAMKMIGVGGISCTKHVLCYLNAGAHACHLATAAMIQPDAAIAIRRELG